MDNYVRLSPEALLDLQRVLAEANKQSLHQKLDDRGQILDILNSAEANKLLLRISKQIEENNNSIRVLSTQIHRLHDALISQAQIIEQLLKVKQHDSN